MGKKKWFIPKNLIMWNKERADNSFVGRCEVTNKRIVLYDKGPNKNYYFFNPIKTTNRLGYIAERKTCPQYFSRCIKEEI